VWEGLFKLEVEVVWVILYPTGPLEDATGGKREAVRGLQLRANIERVAGVP
jgi:hypothetical protein